MAGVIECPNWLTTDWLLAAVAKRKSVAQRKYQEFVYQGSDRKGIWHQLKNQIYLGGEDFDERLTKEIGLDKDLSEIPTSQRRSTPLPIKDYEAQSPNRDTAILCAYQRGGYTMKEIGFYFGLHNSRISRIIHGLQAKDKT